MRVLFTILGGAVILMGLVTQPASAKPATDFEKFLKQVRKCAKQDQGQVLRGGVGRVLHGGFLGRGRGVLAGVLPALALHFVQARAS